MDRRGALLAAAIVNLAMGIYMAVTGYPEYAALNGVACMVCAGTLIAEGK